jgi:DnaJ-class molecular chaperone
VSAPDIPDDDPGDDPNNWEDCPTCGGTGLSDEDGFPCEDCDGNGGIEA